MDVDAMDAMDAMDVAACDAAREALCSEAILPI
jgi:hypothetical protein